MDVWSCCVPETTIWEKSSHSARIRFMTGRNDTNKAARAFWCDIQFNTRHCQTDWRVSIKRTVTRLGMGGAEFLHEAVTSAEIGWNSMWREIHLVADVATFKPACPQKRRGCKYNYQCNSLPPSHDQKQPNRQFKVFQLKYLETTHTKQMNW